MFQKKKPTQESVRPRQPARTINESFRRNNVVLSRKQKEIALHQQSVSQRQAQRKRQLAQRRTRQRIIAAALVVVIGIFLYKASIASIALESNASSRLPASQQAEYQQALLTTYKQHTILSQSWLLDGEAAAQSVKKQFPEIERVAFKNRPLSSQATADVRFRKPAFTWKDASGATQFVDQNGVLFARNLDPTVDTSKLIQIEDQSGVVLEAGNTVLTQSLIQFVGQLYSRLPALYGKEATISRVVVPRSTREVQAQVSGQPYFVKFNTTRNIDEQIGELALLVNFFKTNGINPAQYIDLRVAHKAFYR